MLVPGLRCWNTISSFNFESEALRKRLGINFSKLTSHMQNSASLLRIAHLAVEFSTRRHVLLPTVHSPSAISSIQVPERGFQGLGNY